MGRLLLYINKAKSLFSKTIPVTSWTATHRWDLSMSRGLTMGISLFAAGIGEAFYIQANLGNNPWLVLGDALTHYLSISIAFASFLISCFVLLLWLPLREKIGIGVIANTFIVALGMQIGITVVPKQNNLSGGILFIIIACMLLGIGNAVFITCGLGPGPRQGLMTALHRITRIRVSRLTLGHESFAFVCGALLGGSYGIGTLIFLFLIGPCLALSFSLIRDL